MASFNHLVLVVVAYFLVSAVAGQNAYDDANAQMVSSNAQSPSAEITFKVPHGLVEEAKDYLYNQTSMSMDLIEKFIKHNIESHYSDENVMAEGSISVICLNGCMEIYNQALERLRRFQKDLMNDQFLQAKEHINNFSDINGGCKKCITESGVLNGMLAEDIEQFEAYIASVAGDVNLVFDDIM